MIDFFSEWLTWGNAFYALSVIAGGFVTLRYAKYRKVFMELKEVFAAIEKALEDGKIDKAEKKVIVRETIDVGKALIMTVWK